MRSAPYEVLSLARPCGRAWSAPWAGREGPDDPPGYCEIPCGTRIAL